MSGTPDQPLSNYPPHFSNERVQRLEGELETVKQSLTACELRNHKLLDSLPQIIWVADTWGSVTYLNRYWYEYTGVWETESLKNHIWQTLHPQDRDRLETCWQQAKSHHTDYETECRVQGADGGYRWFLVKGSPIFDEQMQVLEWVAICTDIHDRKQAEDARQRSEQKLRLQIHQSPMGVIEWNAKFEVVEWNPAAEKIFGYPKQEAIGRNAIGFIVPASEHPHVNQAWQDLLHNRGGTRSTNHNLTKSGNEIFCEWYNTPLVDNEGQVLGVVSLVQDVTERQQTEARVRTLNAELEARVAERTAQLERANQQKEELLVREHAARSEAEHLLSLQEETLLALRHSEERYRSLITASAQIIWGTKAEGTFTSQQPGWTAFTGQSFEELKDWGWLNAVHPDDRQHTAQVWSTAVSHCTLYEVTHRLRRSDGEYRYMQVRAVPILEPNGSVREWVGIHTDITERQQAEFALEEQKAFLRNVIDANPNLIFVKDWHGRFTLVNQALAEVYGTTVDEIVGKTDADFNPNPAEVQQYLQDDREVIATLQPKQINEESVSANGETRWFQTIKKPLVLPDQSTQVLGVAIDITERKQVERILQARADELARTTTLLAKTAANLEKRNQELDQFAYVVSHDLKAPLRAIANLSQWLEEDLDPYLNDDTRHQMNLLRGRVHRMEALIDGLLQYSRIGRVDRQAETVAVYDLLQDVVDSLAPPPTFTIAIPPDLPVLKTDRLRLEQVFANLIGNAIKYHDRPDGRIEITASDRGSYYEFTVADDGPGIDPAYHERIFGIFQTLEARDKVESTGIGLSLVKKIVESKGGTIQLTSQPGQGATFRFTWLK
jgi:PAS domain S-box-containing protein